MTITAHCLVKNEARYVWFSVMSVINYVDRVLLWDTSSTDQTVEIIKEILKTDIDKKVEFKKLPPVTPETFAHARQEMLNNTKTDWLLMLDGDEIWWEDSIKKVVKVIKSSTSKKLESIVVPTINLVGDIYHYQDPSLGMYKLAGRTGHLNLRGVNRKIPGLHSQGTHGQWGWVDEAGIMIQDREPKNILYINAPYLHATNVPRAGDFKKETDVPKRSFKRKYELGIPFPSDFYYPEVLFRPKPTIVPSPWVKADKTFILRALYQTPLRRLKRRITKKVGY